MRKNKLLLLLALLLTAATGAWAQESATTYSVKMKNDVKDADKWTVKVGEGEAQALPIDGLKGDGSETVTLTYTGRLKVKGVKATSDAEAASVPDGAISGVFSVSSTKQVYFSKGNLRYASSKWSFFDNQYDYYSSYSADAWDHFGWSTSATTYGMNTSTSNSDYSGDFVDWGATMGAGWFTLSSDEWTYLFKTRSASTVNGTENGRYAKAKVNDVQGVILFPDTYTHPDGVTAPTGVNATDETGWNGNTYSSEDWAKMETAGCVFLPAAGYRRGETVTTINSFDKPFGSYWSATPSNTSVAYYVSFNPGTLNPASKAGRLSGYSVRLVREVATSDAAAAKEPATVTTAPTGAAVVGVGKSTALVSGGVAEGGTMMYAVTTTNTKPTSTDGFSATVPTAQTITASGTVYVWYYVKGDDSHSDSEIAATAIEVPVADIIWDATNVFNSSHMNDMAITWIPAPLTYEGITISTSGEEGSNFVAYDPSSQTGYLVCYGDEGDSFTFTAPSGMKFCKIEIINNDESIVFEDYGDWTSDETGKKFVWSGTAANAVTLGTVYTVASNLNSIVFYLSE